MGSNAFRGVWGGFGAEHNAGTNNNKKLAAQSTYMCRCTVKSTPSSRSPLVLLRATILQRPDTETTATIPLSANVLQCILLCKHQQLIMRHQRLSPRYGSGVLPDLAQGTVCLTESQRARIRVTELVWALRVPNTAGGAFCSRLVCMSTCMGCTREGGYPGSNVYRGVTIALRRGGIRVVWASCGVCSATAAVLAICAVY